MKSSAPDGDPGGSAAGRPAANGEDQGQGVLAFITVLQMKEMRGGVGGEGARLPPRQICAFL